MKRYKDYLLCLLIFLSGYVCAINMAYLRYGFPEHYNGSWYKVAISIAIGVCGTLNLNKTGDRND